MLSKESGSNGVLPLQTRTPAPLEERLPPLTSPSCRKGCRRSPLPSAGGAVGGASCGATVLLVFACFRKTRSVFIYRKIFTTTPLILPYFPPTSTPGANSRVMEGAGGKYPLWEEGLTSPGVWTALSMTLLTSNPGFGRLKVPVGSGQTTRMITYDYAQNCLFMHGYMSFMHKRPVFRGVAKWAFSSF